MRDDAQYRIKVVIVIVALVMPLVALFVIAVYFVVFMTSDPGVGSTN
jgi:hypothetical protein